VGSQFESFDEGVVPKPRVFTSGARDLPQTQCGAQAKPARTVGGVGGPRSQKLVKSPAPAFSRNYLKTLNFKTCPFAPIQIAILEI
jgi:hypothetical protein